MKTSRRNRDVVPRFKTSDAALWQKQARHTTNSLQGKNGMEFLRDPKKGAKYTAYRHMTFGACGVGGTPFK